MDFVLGLDGGGSGCRAVFADRDGTVLGEGRGGPANIMTDREGARAAILACAAEALGGRPEAQVAAVLGLAGANISGARTWLAPTLPFGRARVVHDAVTAVAGALGPDDGIVAALGTGSVFSAQRGGEVTSIGGWGFTLGDEAGGAWLGRAMLAHALRARDGLAVASPLAETLLQVAGGPAGAVDYARRAGPAEFAAMAPHIFASAGDPAAAAVLAEAEAWIAAAIDRLRGDDPLPVVFVGGLGAAYGARLAGRWPTRAPLGSALDGALRLAHALAAEPPA